VTINGEDSSFFKTGKGLRQGDPRSPILFNLVGEVLAKMLRRAADRGLIRGLLIDFRREGIITLQYADDTLLFSSVQECHVENLKGTLMCFKQISGMCINFDKSDFVPMNLEEEEIHKLGHLIGCPKGAIPFEVFGCPSTP
jgi:hypothetical protein